MGSSTRRSNRSLPLLAALGVTGVCGLAQGLAQAQQAVSLDKCEDSITLNSRNQGTFNLRAKAIELGKVEISGCGASIRANNAVTNRADFEDSTWTFEGDVRIDLER